MTLDLKNRCNKEHLSDEIKHICLMSEKVKNVCRALNYFEHFLAFVSAASGCVSISTFPSLVVVSEGIANPALGLKICAVTAGIKRYKSVIKKNRKKAWEKSAVSKNKLNNIEVLISKGLTESYINHDEFFTVNNVLTDYNEIKEEIKNSENAVEYAI